MADAAVQRTDANAAEAEREQTDGFHDRLLEETNAPYITAERIVPHKTRNLTYYDERGPLCVYRLCNNSARWSVPSSRRSMCRMACGGPGKRRPMPPHQATTSTAAQPPTIQTAMSLGG